MMKDGRTMTEDVRARDGSGISRVRGTALTVAGSTVVPIALAFPSGAYFPSAWGWISLIALWALALALLLGAPTFGTTDRAFLALFGLFVALVGFTAFWSSTTPALRELERDLAYLAVAATAVALVRRANVTVIIGGLCAGITLVSIYSLATRLFPNRFGTYDPVAVYRLAAPVGYWNALGILTTIGILLTLGLIARVQSAVVRAVGCAAIVILATTLYFSYSRGALLALGIALVVLFAFDPRRLQGAVALLAAMPAAGVAILYASHQDALTRQHAAAIEAASAGRRLALALLILLGFASVLGLGLHVATTRMAPSRHVRTTFAAAAGAAVILACAAGLIAYGSPLRVASRAWHSFTAPPPKQADLNQRLLSFSSNGRIDLWRLSWRDAKAHPLLGTGAGSFEQRWLRGRSIAMKVRDGHSLYLEVLGELGVFGLVLIVLTLALPLLAARRARRHPFAPFVLAAYVALVVHAGVDWDWEMPVLIVPGLIIAAALLAWARPNDAAPLSRRVRTGLLGALAVAMVFAFITLVGNMSLAQASNAAGKGDWLKSAKDARRANAWAPWSSEPYRLLGEAQLSESETKSAIASFNKAIAKSPDDWSLWFDLARATTGNAQHAALRRAKQLNPLSPEIAELQKEINAQTVITVVPKSPAHP
jgi:hypothetical protein